MPDVTTQHPKGSHGNGALRGTFAERREARRIRREQARALEQTRVAAQAFPQRHPYVTGGLLLGSGVVLGAVASRLLFPSRGAGEQLVRILARLAL